MRSSSGSSWMASVPLYRILGTHPNSPPLAPLFSPVTDGCMMTMVLSLSWTRKIDRWTLTRFNIAYPSLYIYSFVGTYFKYITNRCGRTWPLNCWIYVTWLPSGWAGRSVLLVLWLEQGKGVTAVIIIRWEWICRYYSDDDDEGIRKWKVEVILRARNRMEPRTICVVLL